jgi:hypothetical protein
MKYIHMIDFKDDEFDVATATNVEKLSSLPVQASKNSTKSTAYMSSEDSKSFRDYRFERKIYGLNSYTS